jgi:hypothetical protein
MAFELIHLREQVQTELLAEQKKAVPAAPGQPPAKQKAQLVGPAAGPVAVPQPEAPVAGPVAVGPVRFSAQAVPQRLPTPQDPVAFQQMVRRNQESVRQQVVQMQQQIMQRHQEIIQQHQLLVMGVQR